MNEMKVFENNWKIHNDINNVDLINCEYNFCGYCYAIEYNNKIKIGCTKDIKTRYKCLNSQYQKYGNGGTKKISFSNLHINYKENEKILHKFFDIHRIPNTELFNLELNDFIKKMPKLYYDVNIAEKEIEVNKSIDIFKKVLICNKNNNIKSPHKKLYKKYDNVEIDIIINDFKKCHISEIEEKYNQYTNYCNINNPLLKHKNKICKEFKIPPKEFKIFVMLKIKDVLTDRAIKSKEKNSTDDLKYLTYLIGKIGLLIKIENKHTNLNL